MLAAIAVGIPAGAARAQSDLDRCRAATPEFPQACACVIDRAQAAGITGPTLSQLLSNDMGGLPMEVFQSYGLIYVQCIREAVLAGVPAVPQAPQGPATAPLPPVGAPPSVTLAPAVPPPAPPSAPVQPLAPPALAAGGGTWGAGQAAFRHAPAQPTAEVIAQDGRRLQVFCDPRGGAYLALEGVQAGPGVDYETRMIVTGGDGSILRATGLSVARIEGGRLIAEVSGFHLEALAAGSRVRIISAAHGVDLIAGLSGSSRALRALGCRERGVYTVPPLVIEYTGDWLAYPATPEDQYTGGYLGTFASVGHQGIGLACFDHLHLPQWRGADSNQPALVRVTVDDDPAQSFVFALEFNRGSAVSFEEHPGFLRAVRAGRFLRLEDGRNGQLVEEVYDLSGLEPALAAIGCPDDAGTPLPPPPEGWHLARSVSEFGMISEVVRFGQPGQQSIEFVCTPSVQVRVGPVSSPRRLTMPAMLTAGGVQMETFATLEAGDMVGVALPLEVDAVFPTAEALRIEVADFGLAVDIPLAAPRDLLAGLACERVQPPEPIDPDFIGDDFSGVDDQPWRQVNAPGLGPMLVQRPDENPEFNLHLGCGGRLAFSALAYPGDGSDVFPVSFSVLDEPYPRPAVDFRRDGDWWVAVDPELVRAIRGAPVFSYSQLAGGRVALSYGITDLDRGLAAMGCPAQAQAQAQVSATPVFDLTGRGLSWQPADFGQAFDVMSPNPAPVPGAALQELPGIPGLYMQCDGSFYTAGGWPQNGPEFALRLTVDGDPATTREVTMQPSRSQHFPEFGAYDLGPRVLSGRTLRVTSLPDPGVDVLFPLDTLPAALRAAGCGA